MTERIPIGHRYDRAMTTKQIEATRHALARTHGWRTAILSGVGVLVVCLQRPLGVSAEGIAILQWILCANLLIEVPIARFYFPSPRFPRNPAKGKSSTGRRRLQCTRSRSVVDRSRDTHSR
jgi:hypothetical protein